jgi:hypothetical protein
LIYKHLRILKIEKLDWELPLTLHNGTILGNNGKDGKGREGGREEGRRGGRGDLLVLLNMVAVQTIKK